MATELRISSGALLDGEPLACGCGVDFCLTLRADGPQFESWPVKVWCEFCGTTEDHPVITIGMVKAARAAAYPGPAFTVAWRDHTLAGRRRPDLGELVGEAEQFLVDEAKAKVAEVKRGAKRRVRRIKTAPKRMLKRGVRALRRKGRRRARKAWRGSKRLARRTYALGMLLAGRQYIPVDDDQDQDDVEAGDQDDEYAVPPSRAYFKALGIKRTHNPSCLVCGGKRNIAHPTLDIPCPRCG